MFKRRYRVGRDWCFTFMWAVQTWVWYWPFWAEHTGMLKTQEEARELIEIMAQEYTDD